MLLIIYHKFLDMNLLKKVKLKIQIFNEYRNPFYTWWKVRKIFKRPKCHLYIGERTWFFGLPCLDIYYNPIIDINTSNVGWKWKYDEVRHEWDPYIQIRLFRKWDIIFIFNWIVKSDQNSNCRSMATWEAILDYLYNNKTLQECINRHIWYNKDNEITIHSNIKRELLKSICNDNKAL